MRLLDLLAPCQDVFNRLLVQPGAGPVAEPRGSEARLAACWVVLAGVVVLLLRADPGRGLYALAWLSAVAFPVLWVATTPSEGTWSERAAELACGVLVVAPLLVLLLPWSPVNPDALWGCALGVVASWIGVGLWLGSAGEPRAGSRAARLGCVLGLAAGVPLAQRVLNEAVGWGRQPWASAADALREGWFAQAELSDWALCCLPWLLLAGATWIARLRAPRAAALGLCAVLSGVAGGEDADARLVFGGWSRAGEPTPVWVQADPSVAGLPGVKVAGVRAVHAAQAGSIGLAGPPAPSELVRLEVGRETPSGWQGRTLPEALRAVPMGALLIGTLGEPPPQGVLPPGPQVALQARDVPLLARAGQALDVLWVAPGTLRPSWVGPLSAWAACGGTLVVSDAGEAASFGLPPEPGARASGAGWIVLAPAQEPLRGLGKDALSARLNTRARRQATFDALRGRPPPLLPAEATRWVVWIALAWIVVVLGIVRWAPRSLPVLAVASLLALIGIGSAGARYAGPRVLSAQVLEASAGSDVARRLELVTAFAPRPSEVTLDLGGGGNPPWATHARAIDAWRDPLTVLDSPTSSRVTCRASTAGTSLARLDAVRLTGPISVTRGSAGNRLKLSNQAGLDLERVFVLFRGAAYRVGELSAGRQVEFDLAQAGQRFDRWRLRTLSAREAGLLRAVVYGRELDRELVVVGWTHGSEPSSAPQAAWVAQEPTLVLVRAVGP